MPLPHLKNPTHRGWAKTGVGAALVSAFASVGLIPDVLMQPEILPFLTLIMSQIAHRWLRPLESAFK